MKQVLKEQTKVQAKPCIIKEGVVFNVPEKFKKYNDGKIVFEAILQSADTRNQNKRIYPRDVLDDGIKRIHDQIEKRRFFGELDHPISDNQIRQTTVSLQEVSHLVRRVWWDGAYLKGIVETTPYTPNGKILSGFVADSCPIGFSVRAIADVSDSGGYQKVVAPMVIISYDAVANPSHVGAEVTEIYQEGICQPIKEGKVLKILNEARNLIALNDGNSYTPNALDILVEQKIIQLGKLYW